MNVSQQTTRQLVSKTSHAVCRSCKDSISRSTYATAAAAVQTENSSQQHIPPVTATSPATSYAVNAGVLLSRPPQITRDLHPFESAFFLYQRRLNERLALPFTRYFYYKKRTPADLEWKRKIKQRLTPARDIGRYKGYGDEAWNDELLVGARESEVEHQVEKLLEDAEPAAEKSGDANGGAEGGAAAGKGAKSGEEEAIEKPMPRVTEADLKGDVKSLNRALQRTLYLLVKGKDGKWVLPQDKLVQRETLRMAAERILTQSGGVDMNTWVLGNVPVGHYQLDYRPEAVKSSPNPNELGAKTFFMKARIMAGQLNLKDNTMGLADFKWLAKDEIQKEVDSNYWRQIKNMLAER